ncbi:peptidyl-prolyl cis-trans isomerase FKBP11-like [Acipenser ruthenus]|uniref:peptidyl-prolyl cis-trans isomerase FKBP11-like n=1 Tax=Acipenser ruthenus TaxID=7906 RepID=UPI001560E491|nr:peptidyl-prolyl cis-trans isomerase FKBP11-like [Acipenser ruthenus]
MENKTVFILLWCTIFLCTAGAQSDGSETHDERVVEELEIESMVKPQQCSETSAVGDTLHIHYTGKLMDGKVIDSSLSRDPLVVVLGKKTVIPGLEQSLLGVCVGEKIKATIPPQLAYGKRGFPPNIPADSVLQFEVEVVSMFKQTSWQKVLNEVLPLVCMGLVPGMLCLIGFYLYSKASAPKVSKKKLKEDKKNKLKRK